MTKAEREYLDAIVQLGCCVCVREGRGATPGEPHHLLDGGRRIGHLFAICLCPTHHRSGIRNQQAVSRHPHRIVFEARYGTELELLQWTREMVAA